ncbi:MAG: Crp/Fnr family transcriptional regulator [Terriglobia bacterium]
MKSHQNCIVFSNIIRAHLDSLGAFQTERRYERGQTVYCMGDPPSELFLIQQGRVKILRLSPEGQQKILDIYQQGDIFGELCVCGSGKRTEQAVALEPLSVTSFQMDGLMKLLRRKPQMVLDLLQILCSRLSEAHDQIATLAFDNIPRRLARELLRLTQADGARRGEASNGLSLTHEDLAQVVGTSREMITTVMNQFRERGLVDYSRRRIQAHRERLEKFLRESLP